MKRIGIFGGTFDPVHLGHLILGRDAVEELRLDELHFVPAARNPFKAGDGEPRPAPGEPRVKMLELATAGEPHFRVDPREIHREPPSYSIDTVRAISAENPGALLFFLIGDDNVAGLDRWKNIEELRELVTFAVFTRHHVDYPGKYPLLTREVAISATEIRNRVAHGRSIRYLVYEPVREFIEEHGLYRRDAP